MKELPIHLPARASLARIERAIDQAIAACGLTVKLRGTLRRFPRSVHWHVKCGRERGTLEITLWPQESRAWFTIQDGRRGEWIPAMAEQLGDTICKNVSASE
jgi:hypothetical protein